ncbi:MAG TPA: response regulator [Aggregatilineales bacterium]|nr:response regulator [Aggregatilineales bacterium]
MTKILVIEDSDTLRNDVIEMLAFEGYTVLGAENGLTGVDKAISELPDLIICDIMMPELDGYGVLERLRSDLRTSNIPFIFMTARTERGDIRAGMTQGADDYLTKPFNSDELISTIRARLSKRKAQTQLIEEKVNQLRESITTSLPHELRTPLNAIMGFSDMLMLQADQLTSEQVTEYAQHISSATQRLYRLVENYLSYVRAQLLKTNTQEIHSLQYNISDYPVSLIEFQAHHKAQIYKREADLHMDVKTNTTVQISENDLNKVLEEAIDNAFKFSKEGSPITIQTSVEDGYFIIAIEDKGRGMSPQQVESIGAYIQFDRWMHEQQGNGLGLVIIREFLALYTGLLEIESKSSQGTNLRLKLLVAKENFV